MTTEDRTRTSGVLSITVIALIQVAIVIMARLRCRQFINSKHLAMEKMLDQQLEVKPSETRELFNVS